MLVDILGVALGNAKKMLVLSKLTMTSAVQQHYSVHTMAKPNLLGG